MDTSLIERLREIARSRSARNGPAHDFLHVIRVTENARHIGLAEGADLDVVLPAALLHELFNYPKGHPQSHLSGDVCAEHAADVPFIDTVAEDSDSLATNIAMSSIRDRDWDDPSPDQLFGITRIRPPDEFLGRHQFEHLGGCHCAPPSMSGAHFR